MCTIEKGEIEQVEENTKKEDQNLRGQGDHDTFAKCIHMCRLLQPCPSSALVDNFLAQYVLDMKSETFFHSSNSANSFS